MLQLVVRFPPLIDVFCSMIGIGNIEREIEWFWVEKEIEGGFKS